MQTRGFRTHRAIEAQLKRNPTFSSRLREIFGNYLNEFYQEMIYTIVF